MFVFRAQAQMVIKQNNPIITKRGRTGDGPKTASKQQETKNRKLRLRLNRQMVR